MQSLQPGKDKGPGDRQHLLAHHETQVDTVLIVWLRRRPYLTRTYRSRVRAGSTVYVRHGTQVPQKRIQCLRRL